MSARLEEFQSEVDGHARWFASLSVDQQVEFLRQVVIANRDRLRKFYAKDCYNYSVQIAADNTWLSLGSHIKNCECTDHSVKQMMLKILEGLIVGTAS